MYYQGLTMVKCSCRVCTRGVKHDNTINQEALYNREQHLKNVREYKPNQKLVVPITRGNSTRNEAYAHHVVTTETSAPPAGTAGTAGTTETYAPPVETARTSAHPTGTF